MCRNYLISSLLFCSLVSVSIQEGLWHSYQFGSGHGNRRELHISKVDAVDNFKTQENVLEWRSLSLRNKSIALGMTENGVTILQVDKIGESFATTSETHTPMNATVFDAAIFKYWQREAAKSEIIAVVAVDAQNANKSVDLLWFRLNSSNKLIQFWKWSLRKKITHLNVFKLIDDGDNYNILIANDRYKNYTTVDWYQFHLGQHNDFWLKQAIRLESPINSTAISIHASKTYLSMPQNDKLRIFSLEDQNTRFVNCYNLTAGHVSFVTSFKIAFQSYIAIDGHAAGIYKFANKPAGKNGFLIKQNVENANLHAIDFWLAVSISTYRDEEVLIAERLLDFNTHKSHAIQVIIHHGGRFVVQEEMICDYYGEVSNGLNCLVEEDDDAKGIRGSTFITVNDTLGVLVPRYQKTSGLFVVHTEMKELKSPLEEKMLAFEERKKKIEEKIARLYQNRNETDEFPNFPTKNIVVDEAIEKLQAAPSAQAARRDPTVSQSLPMVQLDMDEITARVSALQETINEMMTDLPKIPSFEPGRDTYETLILNGLVEVQGVSNIKTVVAGSFNGATTDKLVGDIYHVQNEQPLSGHKTFATIRADQIEFDTINEIPSENLQFKTEPLVLQGDVVLDGELIVDGNVLTEKVDDMNLEEEIVYLPSGNIFNGSLEFDTLNVREALNTEKANKFPIHNNYQEAIVEDNPSLESVLFDSLFLPGNLSVVNINGENFNQTLKSLCLKNIETFVPNSTVIEGNVFVKNESLTLFLNGLKYPQDYVLSKSNSFSEISGEKIFNNEVVVGELTTRGTINGIDSNDVVTLSKPQTIPGKISFAALDVTNGLQLDGNIIGSQPQDQINSKPTLLDSNEISSNVNFKTLEVTGRVIIDEDFNGNNLEALLADVVYKTDDSVEINSVKNFPLGLTVLQDLRLASAAINNISVNKFIHKDTEELLDVRELNGSVTFENVLLTGTYDGVDVVKLDQESVKLSGEQFISAEIVFEEELYADELDIKKVLNDVPLEQYLYSNGKMFMDALTVEELSVENLIVQKELTAGQENFDLKEFDGKRFSLTREQDIDVPILIKAARIPILNTQFINEHGFKDLFDLDVYSRKIMDMLMSGSLAVKELIVNDSLKIDTINGKPIEDIMKLCLSTKEGVRELEINFQDVRFGDLHVEKFNDIDFSSFRDNLVFKDEPNVEVLGHKVYFNGFEVKNYIQTSALNNISVYDILRKNEKQEIASPLVILGRVAIEGDCQLNGTFNLVPIANISDAFQVIDENTYQINGDVLFSKGPIIEDLNVKSINGVSMNGFFQDLFYLNGKTAQNVGNITFANTVDISGNLDAGEIDGVDLGSFKEDVVIVTQDGVMQAPVTILSDVIAKEGVRVETDLYTGDIQGVNPRDWKDKAIFTNKGRISQHLNFQSAVIESDVTACHLNNINLTTLVPLKSDLTIFGKLAFNELSSIKDIKVENLVNSRKLEAEYANTVMADRLQSIQTNVIFKGNVVVRESLDIYNLVNEKDLAKVVTTDDDQHLVGTYRFLEKAIVDGDILVSGRVNAINFTKWMQNGVKKDLAETQLVSNSWVTGSDLTFEKDVTGLGYINGLDVHKMAADVEARRAFKYNVEKDLVNNYQKMCADINSVIDTTKKQIYSFKYLDYKQIIELQGSIEYVHQFEHQTKHYLLIKDKGCTAKLFIWMGEFFFLMQEYETGTIAQIVNVYDADDVYLITRDADSEKNKTSTGTSSEDNCNVDGSNVWKFDEEKLLLTQKLNDQTLLHESRVPGTFYAIEKGDVLEYRLSTTDGNFYPIQKWTVPMGKDAAFLEQGLKTGLSVRNGRNLFKLHRQDVPAGIPNNEIAIGNFTTVQNSFIPGRNEEMILLNVGYPRWKKMMAVATHEETSIPGQLDFIKIYEDPMSGKVFHKVPTYKPSSMVSLEFGENGETLLVFLENHELIQIYEYRGVEGFKLRAKANVEGDQLVRIKLPCGSEQKPRFFIGLINQNHFGLLEAVMNGDQLDLDQLTCKLT